MWSGVFRWSFGKEIIYTLWTYKPLWHIHAWLWNYGTSICFLEIPEAEVHCLCIPKYMWSVRMKIRIYMDMHSITETVLWLRIILQSQGIWAWQRADRTLSFGRTEQSWQQFKDIFLRAHELSIPQAKKSSKGSHWDSQQGFTKGRLSLIHLVAFYNVMTLSMDKGNVTDVIYLNMCKVLEIIPQHISLNWIWRLDYLVNKELFGCRLWLWIVTLCPGGAGHE